MRIIVFLLIVFWFCACSPKVDLGLQKSFESTEGKFQDHTGFMLYDLEKKETAVARLRRGQSFGEVALVDEGLRSATARAAQKETRLLVIQRDKLIMLCETYPQLGYRLMYNLAADLAMKIRNTDLRIREQLLYKPQDKK